MVVYEAREWNCRYFHNGLTGIHQTLCGKLPYSNIPSAKMVPTVLRGERPPKPAAEGLRLTDELRNAVQDFWREHPGGRQNVADILRGFWSTGLKVEVGLHTFGMFTVFNSTHDEKVHSFSRRENHQLYIDGPCLRKILPHWLLETTSQMFYAHRDDTRPRDFLLVCEGCASLKLSHL